MRSRHKPGRHQACGVIWRCSRAVMQARSPGAGAAAWL